MDPAPVTLPDGRRVEMYYRQGEGLFERHSGPGGRGWSEPRRIYKTRTDPCQSLKLRAAGSVVTAIADFGKYCYDGEPPFESIAAVGTGDLRRWDYHLTKSFDGWERVKIAPDGGKVTFTASSLAWRFSLVWTRAAGFGERVTKKMS